VEPRFLGYVLVAPALILIVIVALVPLAQGFWFSLQHYHLDDPGATRFVGLDNYRYLLSKDPYFWPDISTTLIFTVATVLLETALGMVFALVLHRQFRGRGLMRAATLVPWAIPTVISAKMWQWMWDDQEGVINGILTRLHIVQSPVVWLAEASTAMPAIIITDVWKTTPFMALLLLAGLQTIPEDLYEAARIDGSTGLQAFLHVTLPLLRPSIVVACIFRTITALQTFDIPATMTRGGPGNATTTLAMYIHQTTVDFLDLGYGSALAVAMFVLSTAISVVYLRHIRAAQ